jgi:hypothetical protein
MSNFDLKKYLTENKLTSNSRLIEEEQTDMFDAITVDSNISANDAYTKFLMNFARTAGEEFPEKLTPNDLDRKYTDVIRRKYKITSPMTFSNMASELKRKGLIKLTSDSSLNENMGSTPEKKKMLLSKIKNLVPGQEREFLVFMAESANSYEDYSKSTVSELLDNFIEFEEGENGEALTPEIMDEVLETYIEGFESGDGTF